MSAHVPPPPAIASAIPRAIDADALCTAFAEGRAIVRCPKCGSADVCERNSALIWAPVRAWTLRGDTDGLVPEEVDCGDHGDVETDEHYDPFVCATWCGFSGFAEDLVIELGGERVAAPVKGEARSYWTAEDDARADAEGWAFFNDGEIQRDDAADIFTSDQAVWYQLAHRAKHGDQFAIRALYRVRRENPEEALRMIDDLERIWGASSTWAQLEREPWLPDAEGAVMSTPVPVTCDQCHMMMINHVACHERRCPNARKEWRDGAWVDPEPDDDEVHE